MKKKFIILFILTTAFQVKSSQINSPLDEFVKKNDLILNLVWDFPSAHTLDSWEKYNAWAQKEADNSGGLSGDDLGGYLLDQLIQEKSISQQLINDWYKSLPYDFYFGSGVILSLPIPEYINKKINKFNLPKPKDLDYGTWFRSQINLFSEIILTALKPFLKANSLNSSDVANNFIGSVFFGTQTPALLILPFTQEENATLINKIESNPKVIDFVDFVNSLKNKDSFSIKELCVLHTAMYVAGCKEVLDYAALNLKQIIVGNVYVVSIIGSYFNSEQDLENAISKKTNSKINELANKLSQIKNHLDLDNILIENVYKSVLTDLTKNIIINQSYDNVFAGISVPNYIGSINPIFDSSTNADIESFVDYDYGLMINSLYDGNLINVSEVQAKFNELIVYPFLEFDVKKLINDPSPIINQMAWDICNFYYDSNYPNNNFFDMTQQDIYGFISGNKQIIQKITALLQEFYSVIKLNPSESTYNKEVLNQNNKFSDVEQFARSELIKVHPYTTEDGKNLFVSGTETINTNALNLLITNLPGFKSVLDSDLQTLVTANNQSISSYSSSFLNSPGSDFINGKAASMLSRFTNLFYPPYTYSWPPLASPNVMSNYIECLINYKKLWEKITDFAGSPEGIQGQPLPNDLAEAVSKACGPLKI